MAKNPNGFTTGQGNLEWGRKARKHEDHLRGARGRAANESILTGLAEILDDEVGYFDTDDGPEALDWYAEAFFAQYDDDPNPYHGDYSEE